MMRRLNLSSSATSSSSRVALRPSLAPYRVQPIPEARQPVWGLERAFGLQREMLEELVHVGHVRPAPSIRTA